MKRLLLIPLILFAGCAKQEVKKTTTVYKGGVKTVKTPPPPAPAGVISQRDCIGLKSGMKMREVLDYYGWPHTQDFLSALQDLDKHRLSYPFSPGSKSFCTLQFEPVKKGDRGSFWDPDKLKLQGRIITLR